MTAHERRITRLEKQLATARAERARDRAARSAAAARARRSGRRVVELERQIRRARAGERLDAADLLLRGFEAAGRPLRRGELEVAVAAVVERDRVPARATLLRLVARDGRFRPVASRFVAPTSWSTERASVPPPLPAIVDAERLALAVRDRFAGAVADDLGAAVITAAATDLLDADATVRQLALVDPALRVFYVPEEDLGAARAVASTANYERT